MPTPQQRQELVKRLHNSERLLVLATAGGGSLAISDLLSEPGASRTVLEAHIPYSFDSLTRFIGQAPVQACSSYTARLLAMACFKLGHESLEKKGATEDYDGFNDFKVPIRRRRAFDPDCLDLDISSEDTVSYRDKPWCFNLIGIGCTASLASDRPKRGEHRFHISIQLFDQTIVYSLALKKDARTRNEEERLVADCILKLLADVAKIETEFPLSLLPGEEMRHTRTVADESWIELLLGNVVAILCVEGDTIFVKKMEDLGKPLISESRPISPEAEYMHNIFAGSFAPIHHGHLRMIELAQNRLCGKIALEIAVRNVDKPPLDYMEIETRLRQVEQASPGQAVWLTRTVRFIDKSCLFRDATFLVGADTLRRIGDQKYSGNNHSFLMGNLRRITYNGCRFLVFARPFEGGVENLHSLTIPDMLRSLSEEVPECEFCDDISSTAIREQQNCE